MAVLRANPVLDLYAKSSGVAFVCSESFGRLAGADFMGGRMEMLMVDGAGLGCDGMTRGGCWASSTGERVPGG